MKKLFILLILLSQAVYAADTKTTALTELTAVADADIMYIVDDPGGSPTSKKITVVNLFDTINTFSKLNTIVTDKTLVNEEDAVTWDALGTFDLGAYFKNGAVAAGFIRIYEDSDDGGNYTHIQTVAQGGNITLSLPPDDGDAGEQLQTNGSGVLTWEAAGGAGATAWDDIGDPDNNGLTTITFDNAELSLLTGDNDAAASFFILQNTDADHTGGNFYLLDLDYSADDGDADADFIKCQDSGGVVYTVQEDGKVTGSSFTDGTATLTGGALTGLTTALTVAQGGTGAASLNDGFVLLGSNTAAITPLDVTTDGAIVIGDGTTDPTTLDVGSSTAITILGTVATGTWQATAITSTYIDNSGETLFIFTSANNVPPATDFATLDTFAAATGLRSVLDFDGTAANETAIFSGIWPSNYDGGGINVIIDYSLDGTDAQDIQFEVSVEVVQDDDDQDGGGQDFGSATDITDTPATNTANYNNRTAAGAISHANCGSPAVGDRIRLKVTRDFDHAANTDDVQLHAVHVKEQ